MPSKNVPRKRKLHGYGYGGATYPGWVGYWSELDDHDQSMLSNLGEQFDGMDVVDGGGDGGGE